MRKLLKKPIAIIVISIIILSLKASYDNGDVKANPLLQWTPEVAEVVESVMDVMNPNSSTTSKFWNEMNKAFE